MGCHNSSDKIPDGIYFLTRLALGTAQLGFAYGIANQSGQVSRSVAQEMLRLAADNGVDILDTAIAYGESEACLGELGTEEFRLVTKLPDVPDGCHNIHDWIKSELDLSLTRLGVSSVYGLLLHRPQKLLDVTGETLYECIQKLKDEGLITKMGVSIYSPDELKEITQRYPLDLVQAPFNLVDRRLHTSGWLQKLHDANVEIHTRSAFLQGLLLMQHEAIPYKFSSWAGLWKKWHDWLEANSVSAVHACLAFPLSFPEIDRIVVGADNVNQLQQVISAARTALSVELPDLHCDEENLINPSRWALL